SLPWSMFLLVGAASREQRAGSRGQGAEGREPLAANRSLLAARLVVVLVVATIVVHLGVANMAACLTLMVPIAVAFARTVGLNPIAAGLIVGIVVDTVILYPVQTAS
ncbi:MAG: hypothetical protein HY783_10280, partial [Chloroflexi bacterium]|nr:hypothetical protein [Chloroflexota bacterium]